MKRRVCVQFLLFGALQHKSTLYSFSSLLTRRAAIILDDSPQAWGEIETALLAQVVPAKLISAWAGKNWNSNVTFDVYMEALASHGAEVEDKPEHDPSSKQYTLVPTAHSELSVASERLTILHDYATRQYVRSITAGYDKLYNDSLPRSLALLDVLLPVTRIQCDDHVFALECEKQRVALAHDRIERLKRRVHELETRP